MSQLSTLTPDRFFAGFLAALTLEEPEHLSANRTLLNRAFLRTVESPAAKVFDTEALNIDFDPLYGVSPWFERQLTRAQRDLLISFPNPSYSVVHIKLTASSAALLLDRIGSGDAFRA